jgi:hypothetical protein
MTVASQSEPTEIGDPNDFCSQRRCCELYSVRRESVLVSTQAERSNACTTNFRGEAGKYGKGIGLRTKQNPICIPEELNCCASKMAKYFYDESFYNKKPLIRQGTSQIHFSVGKLWLSVRPEISQLNACSLIRPPRHPPTSYPKLSSIQHPVRLIAFDKEAGSVQQAYFSDDQKAV